MHIVFKSEDYSNNSIKSRFIRYSGIKYAFHFWSSYTKYYQWEILKRHFNVTFSSPGSVSGSQVLSITLHKEPQPAEPAELAGATATQTKKAVLSQGQRTVACFDLLFRQPSAGPSELVWGGGQNFPKPPPYFVNIEMIQSIYNIVPPDPQIFCTFRRLCSAFLASILCFLFRYTVSVRVEEKQPYRQRTYTWCWAFPPRCSKYKIQIKTIYRTEVSFDWISYFFSH